MELGNISSKVIKKVITVVAQVFRRITIVNMLGKRFLIIVILQIDFKIINLVLLHVELSLYGEHCPSGFSRRRGPKLSVQIIGV